MNFISNESPQEYNYKNKLPNNIIDLGLSFQLDCTKKLKNNVCGIIFSRFNYGIVNNYGLVEDNLLEDWKNYNIVIGLGIKL
tara:strand:- start:2749 stop:2994 length:246 start_codon:yes stop_codon:yes gene_type:complete